MNLQETQPGVSGPQPDEGRRFAYASGDRPLDGYTIKRGIGRGGFGEVYYAESDGGKEVALKLVRRNFEVELRGVGHCLNLKHHNLVSLFDVRTDASGDRWVVMEYVGGPSLEDVIEQHPQGLPPAEALHWFHGMAAGVASLHDHGVVHRDLKPGNTFDDDGVVKIGDYGLSKFISCSRRSGQTESIGTVHYMAPEVANGRYGKEIDIYALGVMLYEMLTGDVPFGGESVGEVLMKHLTAEPDLQRLAEPYRTVVARALAKDPGMRFASVREFAAALPAADGAVVEPVLKEVVSPVRATARPRPRSATGAPPEEPIYRGVRDSWRSFRSAWSRAQIPGFLKFIVILVGVYLLFAAGGLATIFSVGAPLLVAYTVYYVVRAIVLAWSDEPTATSQAASPPRASSPAASPPPASAARVVSPADIAGAHGRAADAAGRRAMRSSRRRRRWQKPAKFTPPPKSARQKASELVGGMLIAAASALAVSFGAELFGGGEVVAERIAWLFVIGTLGAWMVLIPSKIWEGKSGIGDQVVRRLCMLGLGAAVGAAAFALAGELMVRLPYDLDMPAREATWSTAFYGDYGEPRIQAFVVYFAALFAGPRWWRRADPMRNARLQLWSLLTLGGWALFVSFFWRFPQPWGAVVAIAIAVGVQLGSSWIPLEDRKPQLETLDPVA